MHQRVGERGEIVRRYSAEVGRHTHDYHQVVLPFRGTLDIEIERSAGQVKDGVGVFIAAGCAHDFSARGENAFVVCDLPVLTGGYIQPAKSPFFFKVGKDIQGLVDYVTANPSQDGLPDSLLRAWSILLIERLKENGLISNRLDLPLRRAIMFMRTQMSRSITIADIAETAGLSAARLHVIFRDQLSTTPHAYLMSLRLNAAVEMLSSTDLPIAEVAARVGYTDQSALTRALRRNQNRTPGAIRQVYKNRQIGKA